MTEKNFTLVLTTGQKAERVFESVQDVPGWWSGYYSEKFTGRFKELNDEFIFTAADGAHVSTHRVSEVIPNKKIVWLTTSSCLSFLNKKDEWDNSRIVFDIAEKDGITRLTFTHEGLTPVSECYKDCAPAWTQYLKNRLLPLIEGNR